MFPLPFPPVTSPPSRPTTPTLSVTSLPPTTPVLNTLYSSLLRPTLLPSPAAFTQPLLDQFVEHHDPLLENQDLFTARVRLREVGVAVEGIGREFRRRGEEATRVQVGESVKLEAVREGRLRCRLGNQVGDRNKVEREKIIASAKERLEAFEQEMKREEEEALKEFKEGLRKAVGGG